MGIMGSSDGKDRGDMEVVIFDYFPKLIFHVFLIEDIMSFLDLIIDPHKGNREEMRISIGIIGCIMRLRSLSLFAPKAWS